MGEVRSVEFAFNPFMTEAVIKGLRRFFTRKFIPTDFSSINKIQDFFVFQQRKVLLGQFFKCKLYLKNSIKLIKKKQKNCGRPGEVFTRHPYFRKQEYFSFWPKFSFGFVSTGICHTLTKKIMCYCAYEHLTVISKRSECF